MQDSETATTETLGVQKAAGRDWLVYDENGCDVAIVRGGHEDPIAAARAERFAAASDLLAACEGLIEWAGACCSVDSRVRAAHDAIAKAKGGAA